MEPDFIKLKEIKPALSGYIRESLNMMKGSLIPDEKVVHDVRVLMKKSRALLKLSAPQLDNESFKKDIFALREVGRKMCSWRETSVHRKSIKELRKEFPGIFSRLNENERLKTLLKKDETLHEPSQEMIERSEEIIDVLNRTGYRVRFQSMNKLDPHLLVKELELTYLVVTDIYLRCRNNPKPDDLHEFRKKAKDFLYQLFIFRPLNPSVVKALEKRLDGMTQNLGKFNDLTQLVRAIDYNYSVNGNLPAMDELAVKMRDKQDRYLAKVWPTAYKIFCPGQKLVNVLGFKLLVI